MPLTKLGFDKELEKILTGMQFCAQTEKHGKAVSPSALGDRNSTASDNAVVASSHNPGGYDVAAPRMLMPTKSGAAKAMPSRTSRPLALTDYRFTAVDREQIKRALESGVKK